MKRGLKGKKRKKQTKEHFFLILKVTFLLLALWEKSSGTSGQGRAGGGAVGLCGGTQESPLELSYPILPGLTEYSAPLEVRALAGSAWGPNDLLPAGSLSKIPLVQTARRDPFLPRPKPTQMDPQTE